jgi:nitrite reductase/ring-hydroxylating ferredoxin subunit/uncharacterized membrane protein
MPTSTPPRPLVNALEQASALDAPAKTIGNAARDLIPQGRPKEALSGSWLGHPVHPPLTDVVITSFLGASLLDLLAPRSSRRAAQRLIAVGIAAAVPTAITGLSDWADTQPVDPEVRRVGLVHAGANACALLLYSASLAARRRGARVRGALLGLTGAAVLTGGAYLGGHMAYTRGVGVNQTVFDPGPDEWTAVLPSGELRDGEPRSVMAEGAPLLLLRRSDGIYAIHDRCAHRGCLLSEGKIDDHAVTCPCHGSRFDLRDGTLLQGPATASQPTFDVRETDGHVEVRRRTRG